MRRRDIIAAVTAAGAAVAAGLYRFTDLIVKHYPPTPYDDLLTRLTDREQAAKLGARVTGNFDPRQQAARLRAVLDRQDLRGAAEADLVAGHLVEVGGWVLPETLVLLSALAARV